ncbi:MAG: ROK family transcriptional regulator [candidate division KSB1 bacterium]|nr:ROK family transcriptional regulator [candidate division KSB1 bacterium]MDZ7302875.1 ROK family transcriptional regulator [candidate division KSB1 bacterium]MDZ7310451.1 ROK family transcriptional regulator [candidate division KSB1 bacterium]
MRQKFPTKLRHGSFISGNAQVVRNINRAVILNLIREKQPISRITIARLSGLNKSTVSSIVADLLEEELIYEQTVPSQSVGRTPINLCLKSGAYLVGAINIDAPISRLAIVDLDGSVKESSEVPFDAENPERFISRCIEQLFHLRKRLHIDHLKGIGVSIAGIVDPHNARVVFAPRLGWEDFEIAGLIRQLCPEDGIITIDNDARASALAELWYGNHDLNLSNFVFLLVGPGIGTGIVVKKELIHGSSYAAGEFGHMTLFEGGELCSCGNYGCWEAYASDRATVRRYMAQKQQEKPAAQPIMLQDIIDLAINHNETVARDTLRQTGHYLGMGIADIIKAIDPEAIIIGGRITSAWEIVYPEIMQTLSIRAFFGKKRNIRILPTSLAVRPRLLGAATLVIKEIFSDFKITR